MAADTTIDMMGLVTAAMEPIRVLHLRDSPWVDGPGRTILESGAHFDRERIEYHIGVLLDDPTKPHPMIEAARQRHLNVHAIVDRGGFDRRVLMSVSRLVTDLRIEVLHTSDMRTNIYGWLCRRRHPRVKLVTTTHGWIVNTARRRVMRIADKILLRKFDAVVMVSNAMRRLVPEWWLPSAKVTVIHNALVTDSYRSDERVRSRRRVDGSEPVVLLNVGRLSPEKAQALLLRAFAVVSRDNLLLRLKIAGTGPLEHELRELAGQLGVAEHVEFLGYVGDMPSLYDEVDLVVQSSLTEGLPNVVLEAGLLCVPIVATAVGGTDEVIEHGVSGWLIKAGSMEQLAEGIRAFLRDRDKFAAMAKRAHDRVESQFDFRARTQKMMTLYERLVRAKS
jgi:glycosyltransferase involved in cell wall biosynthesis